MGELPNWISPFHEHGRGPRGVADGFIDLAVWSEPLVPSGGELDIAPEETKALPAGPARALTIDEAKLGLAITYKVAPEAIEISIRW